jgi:DNA-binding NtrC family response regulator
MIGRVLVVDDDQSVCELLEVMLRRRGLTVEWRTSGLDALELAVERDFDVILTDLGMASLSGVELCERLREVRPEVPVVVVTGDAGMAAAVGAVGAFGFVTKPVDAALLAQTVNRALQRSRLREVAVGPAGASEAATVWRSCSPPPSRRARPCVRTAPTRGLTRSRRGRASAGRW